MKLTFNFGINFVGSIIQNFFFSFPISKVFEKKKFFFHKFLWKLILKFFDILRDVESRDKKSQKVLFIPQRVETSRRGTVEDARTKSNFRNEGK